jgi:hypothetical protein
VCPGNKDTCNQARTSDDDGKLVLGLHDPQVPVRQQEGVFFGNLFVTPPQAYWATGADRTDNIVAARLCSGWRSDDVCPFLRVGAASTVCGQNKGTATVCNANGQQWANAITVFK